MCLRASTCGTPLLCISALNENTLWAHAALMVNLQKAITAFNAADSCSKHSHWLPPCVSERTHVYPTLVHQRSEQKLTLSSYSSNGEPSKGFD